VSVAEVVPPVLEKGRPQVIDAEEMKTWRQPRTRELVVDLAGPWLQIAVCITAAAVLRHPLVYVIAFLLIAGAMHGLNCITHEFAHNLVIPRRRRLNDLVGRWLFAAPGGLPFDFYRKRHFEHHRLVSTARDTKLLYQREFSGWRMGYEVILSLSGFDYLWQVVKVLSRKDDPAAAGAEADKKDDKKDDGASFGMDVLPVVIAQTIIAAVFIAAWGIVPYIVFWIWPLMAATLFGKLRSVVEHSPFRREWGREGDSPYFRGSPAPVIRSVVATPFERLFMTKVNFCFHREHHLWPGLSYQFLPVAYDRLRRHLNEPVESGYLVKLAEFVRDREPVPAPPSGAGV
jgi:fatty acid desaturase